MTSTHFHRTPMVTKRAVSKNRHQSVDASGSRTRTSDTPTSNQEPKHGSRKRERAASTNAAGVPRWWAHPSLLAWHVMTFLIVAFLDYMGGLFLAVRMVPTMMASLAAGMGVDMHGATLSGFMVWAMSSLMVVAFMAALGLVTMVALWRLRRRLLTRLSARVSRRLGT